MKKCIRIAALTLCTILGAALFTACASGQTNADSADSSSAQIPNPWEECKTLDEAAKLAGFDYQLPAYAEELGTPDYIAAIQNDILEVLWKKNGQDEVLLRKGTQQGDISGDYNDYATTKTEELPCADETVTVTFKGNADGIHLAIWQQGGYSYSVFSSTGLTEQEAADRAAAILEANSLPTLLDKSAG